MTGQIVAVTVIGDDRPGIVAAVTSALYEAGCNLEDVTSTILRGHFAMVLIVRSTRPVDELETRLHSAGDSLGLTVAVRPVDDLETAVASPTHVVSVYGADRPGIVSRVSEALAGGGANITDLTSRVIGGDEAPVYALMLEVSVPIDTSVDAILDPLRAELDVDITSRVLDADVL